MLSGKKGFLKTRILYTSLDLTYLSEWSLSRTIFVYTNGKFKVKKGHRKCRAMGLHEKLNMPQEVKLMKVLGLRSKRA